MKRTMHWLAAVALGGALLLGGTVAMFGLDNDDNDRGQSAHVLYFETNNAAAGQNAVVAYRRNTSDGSLSLLGVFPTGGTGFLNVNQRIGPDDTDQEVIASPDQRLLFAVNAGSNDISVFRIRRNGRLKLVKGSPFPSNGKQPSSLLLVGDNLYVVNRGDGVLPYPANGGDGTVGPGTPGATNYTGFEVEENGRLEPIAGSTIVLADGSSPTQLVPAVGGNTIFGDNFLVPNAAVMGLPGIFPAAGSNMNSLSIGDDGALSLNPAVPLPQAPPLMLGMRAHPSLNILYTGLVGAGRMAWWTYTGDGTPTFGAVESDPNNLGAEGGLCWIAIDPGEQYLYASSVVTDVIDVFSIANPTNPTRVQNFALGGVKAARNNTTPEPYQFTTTPFNLEVDPSGRFLYVLNNQTCVITDTDATDASNCGQGTAIHILAIDSNGLLSETAGSPLVLSPSLVPYHGKGMVVLNLRRDGDDD